MSAFDDIVKDWTTEYLVSTVQAAPADWNWMTHVEKAAVRELDRRGIGMDGTPLVKS